MPPTIGTLFVPRLPLIEDLGKVVLKLYHSFSLTLLFLLAAVILIRFWLDLWVSRPPFLSVFPVSLIFPLVRMVSSLSSIPFLVAGTFISVDLSLNLKLWSLRPFLLSFVTFFLRLPIPTLGFGHLPRLVPSRVPPSLRS